MKIVMSIMRLPIKWAILLLDPIFRPKFKTPPPEHAARLARELESLELFQFAACPFCVKVRWAMRRMGLRITIVDAKNDLKAKNLLATNGGKVKVPCLRIKSADNDDRWLYESSDIIDYLDLRFSKIC